MNLLKTQSATPRDSAIQMPLTCLNTSPFVFQSHYYLLTPEALLALNSEAQGIYLTVAQLAPITLLSGHARGWVELKCCSLEGKIFTLLRVCVTFLPV